MMWRLNDLPVYSSADSTVSAHHYNRIRLALRRQRLNEPIRLQLKGLRNIDMILDEDSWVCVDRLLNDLPIVAWTHFDTRERDNLHQPIPCRLHYYHYCAAMIVRDALDITDALLADKLAPAIAYPVTQVSKFRRQEGSEHA